MDIFDDSFYDKQLVSAQQNAMRNVIEKKSIDIGKRATALISKAQYELNFKEGLALTDLYLNQKYLDFFYTGSIKDVPKEIKKDHIRIYEITKLVYDTKEQINDKLISIYSSLHSVNSAVAIIIKSNGETQNFYVATRSAGDHVLAGNTLHDSLQGNFPGIAISDFFEKEQKDKLLDSAFTELKTIKSLASVSLIPSERDTDKNKFVQGIEKFIGSMGNKIYTAILLAVPVNSKLLAQRKDGFEGLYSQLSPHNKISLSYAHSESESVGISISSSFTESINKSVSDSNGTSSSTSTGSNWGSNDSSSWSFEGYSSSSGSSSGGHSSSTSGQSFVNTVTNATSKARGQVQGSNNAKSMSDSDTMTLNFENKTITNLMEKADKELRRIELSQAYGMWDFCAYFYSDDTAITAQAANIYKSLCIGNESSVEKAHINIWNIDSHGIEKDSIVKILRNIVCLIHPVSKVPAHLNFSEQLVTPTNMVNGKELPIVLGLPRKSIAGLAVVEMAEFGREVVYENLARIKRFMDFGCIYHMGTDSTRRVNMDVDLLASHCFITGSSGSGKSWATYQLLDQLLQRNIKMLVIEPAKGEYKQVFGGLKSIKIFTTDPKIYKMLRINPFEFPENLHVLTHIEKLIQIFNASWALYAAMPAILKEAVVKAYVACGWDVENSIYIEGICDHKYPVFKDVLRILPEIIDSSDYSQESKGDYKGALLTRVQSMTSGIAGLIFERSEGIKDKLIFDSNVIVDLSDIGSEETIALLMGVLIMRLGEYRQSERKALQESSHDSMLRHVTVLEEAHNLLKRTNKEQSTEGSNIVGKSVEMISNSIKEMRTYGEGFIIIDQSPMAVDTAAIENTSTKIIMNTPAKDACEELSSALSLNSEQAKELSRLTTGVAAVLQKGWLTPVLMKVDRWSNKYEAETKKYDGEAIRKLRAELLRELLKQGEEETYTPLNLKKIINYFAIDEDAKEDYRAIADMMRSMLLEKAHLTDQQIGSLMLRISNTGGLLKVIKGNNHLTIGQCTFMEEKYEEEALASAYEENEKDADAWIERYLKSLDKYVAVDSYLDTHKILYYILAYLSNKAEDYNSIYSIIYLKHAAAL